MLLLTRGQHLPMARRSDLRIDIINGPQLQVSLMMLMRWTRWRLRETC